MTDSVETLRAVLWDMDGTLVDTEPYWMEAEYAVVAEHGGTWSREHAIAVLGRDLLDCAAYIREHGGVDLAPEQIVDRLLDEVVARVREVVPWRPGAVDLLAALGESGIPCGLVTMSYARFVAPVLASLPADTFATVVTGDEVEFGKPHPQPYLTAAAALGVGAGDCLAIEDSNTGARSAESAGCAVLVVPNHVPVVDGPRRIFRDTLDGLGPDTLHRVWAEVNEPLSTG